jgi:hypothetical protein
MNKDELIKELEELRDIKDYSQSKLLNTGYRTAILDAIDLVKKLTIPDVVGRSKQLICDTCKSGLIDYPEINRRTCRCGGLGYNVTD